MQTLSGSIHHLQQPHAQSILLFPTVFDIKLLPFFDRRINEAAVFSDNCPKLINHLSNHFMGWNKECNSFLATESVNS